MTSTDTKKRPRRMARERSTEVAALAESRETGPQTPRSSNAVVQSNGPTKTEKIDAPLDKRGVEIKFDGAYVKLVEIRRNGEEYDVRMAGDINSPMFKDYERAQNIVKLFDANGKEFQRGSMSLGGGRAPAVEFTASFPTQGMSEPKELHVTMPTGIRELRVPFEFTNLPLPH